MINKELLVVLTAILPVSELRGAIPLGLGMGFSIPKTFLLAIVGNLIPVVPLFFLFKPLSEALRKSKIFKRFFDWYLNKTKERAKIIKRYEFLGLAIFVSIPLPFTGAWTGTIAASLFNLRFSYTFLAIVCGVLLAGLIVTILSVLGIVTFKSIFVPVGGYL